MKETLFLKLDRNLASPTESADGGKGTRERSGADCSRMACFLYHRKFRLLYHKMLRTDAACSIIRAVRRTRYVHQRGVDKGVCNAGGTAGIRYRAFWTMSTDYPSRNIIL